MGIYGGCDANGWLGVIDDSEDLKPLSTNFILAQNYPNPFNPTTTISFELPAMSEVKLQVFDINGRRVGVGLAPTRQYPPGTHAITFDGSHLPSGIYIYRIDAGEFTGSGKMLLLK